MNCHLFKDYFEIKIENNYNIDFLEKIKRSGISVYNLKIEIDCISFDYSSKYDSIVNVIIESNKIKVISKNRKGIKKYILNRKKIIPYLFGMLMFAIIIKLFTFNIWNIKFEGNSFVSDLKLEQYLKTQNIIPGVKKSAINCKDLENKIRIKFSEISWVCVEVKGNNLIVHINEQYKNDYVNEIDATYNLTSKSNSVIHSIITRNGTPKVKKGDVVKPNDILISGVVEVKNEFDENIKTYYTPPEGEVIGETVYCYKKIFPLSYVYKDVYESKESYYLDVCGKSYGKKDVNNKESYTVNFTKGIKFIGNYYLPIRIGINKTYFFKEKILKYKENEAKKIASKKFDDFLLSLEEKQMQILEKSVKIYVDRNQCITEGTIKVLEPLIQVSFIDYVEEGTNKFNECN